MTAMSDKRWGELASGVNGQWRYDERLEIVAEMDRLRGENAKLESERNQAQARIASWKEEERMWHSENAALAARLAEAERVMREALKYIKPVIDGNGPARTLILHYLKHANPRPPKEATMATNDGSAPAYRVTTRIGMSREICKMCYHVNRIGFTVPDDVWSAVVPPIHSSDIVCLDCFTRLADEKLIPWDVDIRMWPVSLATHLDAVKCAALAPDAKEAT